MKEPNWKIIDQMMKAKPDHIEKAKEEGFSTLSQAIYGLMAGKKYKRLLDISPALGMSTNTLAKYRNEMFGLGVSCFVRPQGSTVAAEKRKASKINGGYGKKRTPCPNYVKYGDDVRYSVPDIDDFGFTRGFCR